MSARVVSRGVEIEVRSEVNWLTTGLTHVEVEAMPRTPLPITETGYRSHFVNPGDLAEFGSVEDFVRQWLETAAVSWNAQLKFF